MKTFHAEPNTAHTIIYAYEAAIRCGESGITRDGSIVTTRECTNYRIKKNDLVMKFVLMRDNSVHITYENKP